MAQETTTYPLWQFARDLAYYIRPYRKKFWAGVLLRFSSDLGQLYPAWAVSQVVLILSSGHSEADITKLSIILGILIFVNMYTSFVQDFAKFLGFQVAEIASLDLYKECLAHIFKLDLTWQEVENSGNKMKRIDRGHDGVNESIRRIFDTMIQVLVNTLGIVFIFFTINTFISMSLIFFIVTFFILGNVLLKKAIKQEEVVNHKYEDLSGLTFESLNNISTIKSLAIAGSIMGTIKHQSFGLIKEIRKRIFLFRSQSAALSIYYYLFEFFLVVFIIMGIVNGQYQVSLLVLFIGLFEKVGESIWELVNVSQQVVVSKIWVARAMHILHTEPEIEHPTKLAAQLPYPTDWKKLEIKNVHFRYNKRNALKNISLTISRGESVGIVGLSGSGKSTLFKLLLDLYEHYDGDIFLDDVAFKNMQRQSYIDHVSVVLQDTELFNMSLKDNITLAQDKPQLSLAQVITMAHLDDVVGNLKDGLDTLVGEKGVKLSGGQRQRVGIARALYRQPDILLLDEATSHLDAYSEKQIQQALSETMHNYTTIVIAHRLSTIKELDKIVVLEYGNVVESGTFQELIKQEGSFARMWKQQKL